MKALTRPSLRRNASTKQRPFPHRRLCCPLGSSSTTAASDAHPARHPLPEVIGYRARCSGDNLAGHRAGEGLPSSRRHYLNVPRPIRRGVLGGCASRLFTASMAFAVISAARLPLLPPSRAEPLTTLQASLNAADRPVAPPCRAFDAALRRRAFPPEAGSLLPGLLAATRTGLPPASDDELTLDQVKSNDHLQQAGRTSRICVGTSERDRHAYHERRR